MNNAFFFSSGQKSQIQSENLNYPGQPNLLLSDNQFQSSRNEDRFVFGYVSRVEVQP